MDNLLPPKEKRMLVYSILFFTLFISLGLAITFSSFVKDLDTWISLKLYLGENPFWAKFFNVVTRFGGAEFVYSTIGLILILFLFIQHRRYIILMIVTIGLGNLVEYLFKLIFQRERPPSEIALVMESTFSFPSGHSTVSVLMYGLFVFILIENENNNKLKIVYLILALILMLLVSYSRVALGVHFFFDILGAWLFSVSWIFLSLIVNKRLLNNIKS